MKSIKMTLSILLSFKFDLKGRMIGEVEEESWGYNRYSDLFYASTLC